MSIIRSHFRDINHHHPFFDSIRKEYPEFDTWFQTHPDRSCFLFYSSSRIGFISWKKESHPDSVTPPLKEEYIKICTIKATPKGEGIGTDLLKTLEKVYPQRNFYLTTYSKERLFIRFLLKMGFVFHGRKEKEYVWIKRSSIIESKGQTHDRNQKHQIDDSGWRDHQ